MKTNYPPKCSFISTEAALALLLEGIKAGKGASKPPTLSIATHGNHSIIATVGDKKLIISSGLKSQNRDHH